MLHASIKFVRNVSQFHLNIKKEYVITAITLLFQNLNINNEGADLHGD